MRSFISATFCLVARMVAWRADDVRDFHSEHARGGRYRCYDSCRGGRVAEDAAERRRVERQFHDCGHGLAGVDDENLTRRGDRPVGALQLDHVAAWFDAAKLEEPRFARG